MTRWLIEHSPAVVVAWAMVILLILHEILYHVTIADAEFPLTVLADDHRVFVLSHGGLDMVLAGAVAVVLLAGIEVIHEKKDRESRESRDV